MPKISFSSRGSFKKAENFLAKMSRRELFNLLDGYAKEGVTALAAATPIDSGETSASWEYEISRSRGRTSIRWTNSHVVNGVPIAIILQYGHGTGTGGYVQGRDYINPTIKPIFDKIANNTWKAVVSA
ncbi:minor tail protein [Arthrobacter phage Qui]|jgi:hypothetical protein|uniref:Minor tail protein n=1 Tax=Arthrobacter phage Qui TaxID=2603260 RepID=A0A5B8WHN7_9CAUD|nr:minor tail protein [Arthrobacter phage Qui]QED11529.1 minor tail protein [Arthrobacter phage Qui]QOC56361.1 minor tail protein [Arthrobacter phage Paella]